MATTVIGLIEDSSEAKKAVDELLKGGFDRKDVGVITGDVIEEAASAATGASVGMLAGGLATHFFWHWCPPGSISTGMLTVPFNFN